MIDPYDPETSARLLRAKNILNSEFTVEGEYSELGTYNFLLRPHEESFGDSFRRIAPSIKELGFLPFLRRRKGGLLLKFVSRPPSKPARKTLNLTLFLITCTTVFFSGWWMFGGDLRSASLFAVSLLSLISLHEIGHKLMIRSSRLDSSLPYFIPGPPPLGTFGAVITQGDIPTNRDELFDLAFGGPIVGFAVTIVLAIMSVFWSSVIPIEKVSPGSLVPLPLLFSLIFPLLHPLPGNVAIHGPLISVAWVGAFITFLNLIPVSQLDGGHLFRAALGRSGQRIASIIGLIFVAFVDYALAFILLMLVFVLGYSSPEPLDDISPLSKSRKLLVLVALIVVLLCVPVRPLRPLL